MAQVTASLVKELRDRTGLGMMECKRALAESDGDIDKAIEELRKSSGMKAAKKAGRTAAEGLVAVKAETAPSQCEARASSTFCVAILCCAGSIWTTTSCARPRN